VDPLRSRIPTRYAALRIQREYGVFLEIVYEQAEPLFGFRGSDAASVLQRAFCVKEFSHKLSEWAGGRV
jgi:hypothetical protein